jgi:hypothetical protein
MAAGIISTLISQSVAGPAEGFKAIDESLAIRLNHWWWERTDEEHDEAYFNFTVQNYGKTECSNMRLLNLDYRLILEDGYTYYSCDVDGWRQLVLPEEFVDEPVIVRFHNLKKGKKPRTIIIKEWVGQFPQEAEFNLGYYPEKRIDEFWTGGMIIIGIGILMKKHGGKRNEA